MGPIGCSETSVKNYRYSLRSSPEESGSHLLRGGWLKSRLVHLYESVFVALGIQHGMRVLHTVIIGGLSELYNIFPLIS